MPSSRRAWLATATVAVMGLVSVVVAVPARSAGLAAASSGSLPALAFTSNRTGPAHVWLLDRGRQTQLSDGLFDDLRPSWSPDGRRIVFARGHGYQSSSVPPVAALVVVEVATRRETVLLATAGTVYGSPAWSPDGTRIAYARATLEQNVALDVLDLRTGRSVELVGPQGKNTYPSWSPDSQLLVYNAGFALAIVPANGGAKPRVIPFSGKTYAPAWSPDGSRIAFATDRDGGGRQIYTIAPDGSAVARITHDTGEDKFPAWTPDGRAVLYSHGPVPCVQGATCNAYDGYQLTETTLATGETRVITTTSLPESQFGESFPVAAPNGTS